MRGPVNGGRCSGPITVAGATATITEALSDPATDVKSISVRPAGECTSFGRPHPIINWVGNPVGILITEVAAGLGVDYVVDSITCTGCRPTVQVSLLTAQIRFTLGPGTNVVTYTNRSRDP